MYADDELKVQQKTEVPEKTTNFIEHTKHSNSSLPVNHTAVRHSPCPTINAIHKLSRRHIALSRLYADDITNRIHVFR